MLLDKLPFGTRTSALKAVGTLRRELAMLPEASGYHQLARAELCLGRMRAAEGYLQEAVLLRPTFGEAWALLCGLRLALGDPWGAMAASRETLKVSHGPSGHREAAVFSHGLACLELGRYEEALAHGPYVETRGGCCTVRMGGHCVLFGAYLESGRACAALAQARDAVGFDPRLGAYHLALAVLFSRLSNAELCTYHGELAEEFGLVSPGVTAARG